MSLSDDRRRTLLEAAASEAKRYGHASAGPLHLALAVGRRAPLLLDVYFGGDSQRRLADAVRRQPSGSALQLEALLANCRVDSVEEILAALASLDPPLLPTAQSDAGTLATPVPEEQVPATWSVGDVIMDIYEVVGVAGEGTMGRVYRVRHRHWGIDLAVKSPHPGFLESDADQRAFEGEAQRWIDLGLHPHICSCHYVRRLGGIPRIFAEFAEMGALADQIHDHRLYADAPVGRLLDISAQFARGLAFAHERGVVHQDVKPANVLLTSAGDVKIADFGIARVTPTRTFSKTAVSMGGMTIPYRSPEQAKVAARIQAGQPVPTLTSATDVWSFAVSLVELFTGGLPSSDGQTAGRALNAYLRHRPTHRNPPIPLSVANLIRRCLQKNPSKRPSMEAVARELAEIFERETGIRYPRDTAHDGALLAGELSNRALSMLDLGRPDEAERLWVRALDRDRNHPQTTYNHGLDKWRRAQATDDELVRRLEAVRASHELDWVDEYLLALVHLERGDLTSAAGLLEQAGDAAEVAEARRLLAASGESAEPGIVLEWEHGRIDSIAITPDGRRVLAGSYSRTGIAQLWDLGTGRMLHTLASLPTTDRTRSASTPVALTADGGTAVTGCYDGTVRVWELAGGTCLRTIQAHPGNVVAIALTPDGRLAMTWPLSPQEPAKVWDLGSGRCLREIATMGAVRSAALDDRAAHVLVGGSMGAQLWEPASGRRIRNLREDGEGVLAVALSQQLALTGGADGVGVLWDLAAGKRLHSLIGHTGSVGTVALAADGRTGMTGGLDSTVRLWDLRSGRCVRTLDIAAPVAAVACTPDGRHGIVGTVAGIMRVWRFDLAAIGRSPWAHTRPRPARDAISSERRVRAALTETRQLIATGALREAGIRLQSLRRLPGYERHPDVLAQWRIAVRAGRHTCKLGGWQSQSIKGSGRPGPLAVALCPDGRRAVTASATSQLWDLETGASLGSNEGPRYGWSNDDWYTAALTAVATSRDARRVLIGSAMGAGQVWEPETNGCRILHGHAERITAVALSADARVGLTASEDADSRLWDLDYGVCIRTLHHPEKVRAAALTADGQTALTGSADGVARLWRLGSVTCTALPGTHGGEVCCAALSATGSLGLTGDADGIVRTWDLHRGSCVRTLDGHAGRVVAVALSIDARVALTGSEDRTALLWDLESGRLMRTLAHTATVTDVALTPDARLALTASADGVARTWELDWEYEFPKPVMWHESARPLLAAFLQAHVPYQRILAADGPLRHGSSRWASGDLERLMRELEWAGLGWLRRDGVLRELLTITDRQTPVAVEVPDPAAAPPKRKPDERPPNLVSDEVMQSFFQRHAATLHAEVERMAKLGHSEGVISIQDPAAPGLPPASSAQAGTRHGPPPDGEYRRTPWRRDPALATLFHPDYPDYIRVAFLLPDERRVERLWVRTDTVDRAVDGYAGVLLPHRMPLGRSFAPDSRRVSYRVTPGIGDPVYVSPEMRANLGRWTSDCSGCGFDLLLEPAGEILRRQFVGAPDDITFEAFTTRCPLCSEAVVVTRRQGSSS